MSQANPLPQPNLPAETLAHLHALFLAILPKIELHGRIYFRHLKSLDRKEEAIQEMRSLAWKWLLSLHKQGKDPNDFMMAFTTFLARAVNSGRRVVGMAKSKDVLNKHAQKCYGFKVESLPIALRTCHDNLYATPKGQDLHDAFEERLCDNTITPVIDQVQFRIDFPAWLLTLDQRRRDMITDMAQGEKTQDLAEKYKVSEGRISQMRREFQIDWNRFLGELEQPSKGDSQPS